MISQGDLEVEAALVGVLVGLLGFGDLFGVDELGDLGEDLASDLRRVGVGLLFGQDVGVVDVGDEDAEAGGEPRGVVNG